ncbi:e3 ufm1-protein ligase 1 like protein, partial [Quercus suber]
MDDELLELQRQFESAQQAKSSIRLSERNVVELEQLRHEMVLEIKKLGRVSLIDLADTTGVDLYYVESQAQHVVSDDPGLMLFQGEIISQSYWDSMAEEINDRLQECSQIALAEIATQLNVGSEMITSVLEPRLGTLVKGRLEGGQLYTPAYVARVSAMVRGSARGITVPTNLSALWSSLQQQLHEMDGASGVAIDGSFFQSLFNGIVKEGEVLGSLRAGVHWTPNVFAIAQKECVDSFFSQNSFISYENLHKLGISQPVQFLQSRYPEGVPLVSVFVHPSMIEMLDAATEDALERGSWIDSLSVLPASFGPQDAFKIMSLCPSVQLALKSNKALIFGESYVFSNGFVKVVYDRMEKELEHVSVSGSSGIILSDDSQFVNAAKVGHDSNRSIESFDTGSETGNSKQAVEKGPKKRKGKSAGNAGAPESVSDNQEYVPTKSKKNQRKGKDTSSFQVSDSKTGAKKESVRAKEDNLSIPSEEWIMQKILMLVPDFEEQGVDDPETILRPLANHLRPMLINSLKARRKAVFTENADRIKRLLDNLQRKLDESFLNMQLYERALDLFEDDQAISVNVTFGDEIGMRGLNYNSQVILHRHLLRTAAASILDTLLHNLDIHNKLKNGIEVEEAQNSESVSLSPGERTAIAKSFPGSLSNKALAVVDALEGKEEDCSSDRILTKRELLENQMPALKGLSKDLTSQVSAETDPVSLLAKVVSLLYIQVHHKALQAPGRAISVAVSRLKDKLDDSAYKILTDYQTATVTLLALISAATGDEEDCSSDRILTKRELLENQMPALKGL